MIELQPFVSVSFYVFFPAHCKYCMLFVHQHPMCFTMCINCTLHQFGLQGGCPSNHHPYYFQIGSPPRFKLLSCFVRRLIVGSLLNTKIQSNWDRNMFWGQTNSQPPFPQLFGRKKSGTWWSPVSHLYFAHHLTICVPHRHQSLCHVIKLPLPIACQRGR